MTVLRSAGEIWAIPAAAGSLTVRLHAEGPVERPDQDLDHDGSAFLLGTKGRVRGDHDFVFYNQPASGCGAVRMGDADDSGDDAFASFTVSLEGLPDEVHAVAFALSIHEAASRRQDLRLLRSLALSVSRGEEPLARIETTFAEAGHDAALLADLVRSGGGWSLKVRAHGLRGGLGALARDLGVNV